MIGLSRDEARGRGSRNRAVAEFAAYYRTGENAVGISSLFACRIGRTPVCGGHWPPASGMPHGHGHAR